MLKTWTQVVLLNLALTAAGLRAFGSGKTTPCAETSRLSMVCLICSRNQGRYTPLNALIREIPWLRHKSTQFENATLGQGGHECYF